MFRIFAGGALRTPTRISVMAGGQVRAVQSIKAMVGGVLKLVYQGFPTLTASASPDAVSGAGGATVQTNQATVTPAGGVGPYTYSWACTSFSGATAPYAVSPSFATTNFRQNGSGTATFVCTVTDSLGHTATAAVTATFTSSGGGA